MLVSQLRSLSRVQDQGSHWEQGLAQCGLSECRSIRDQDTVRNIGSIQTVDIKKKRSKAGELTPGSFERCEQNQ
jgi:hypothetical protein